MGFPRNSVGIESTCNAGDPGLIPWSGRSTEEGIGYPLQYSWASLVAQLVKNPPAMWETWVYIHIYIYTYIYIYTHTHTCIYVHIYIYSHYAAFLKIIKHCMSVISQLEKKR